MSVYFSRIATTPDDPRAAAHARAKGPYAEHQWLWARFFRAPEGTARDFLFRRVEKGGMPTFYTVSARLPSKDVPGWEVQSKVYAPELEAGQRLRFELRANPTVSNARDGKTKRDDVVMDAKKRLLAERGLEKWDDWRDGQRPLIYELISQTCTDWLRKQGERWGFTVEPDLAVDAYRQFRHAPQDKNGGIVLSTVDFSGQLQVTDAERFTAALIGGVGRAKAFGCGLLLVRRAG